MAALGGGAVSDERGTPVPLSSEKGTPGRLSRKMSLVGKSHFRAPDTDHMDENFQPSSSLLLSSQELSDTQVYEP